MGVTGGDAGRHFVIAFVQPIRRTAMPPETVKNLKDATSMLATLEPLAKKAHKEFGDYHSKLEQAIKTDDGDLIETYRPQLEKIVTGMESLEGTATGALVAVKGLRSDEAFMAAKHKEVEMLAERIVASQDLLTKDIESAETLFKEADKKLNALQGGHKNAVKDFALLDGDVKTISKLGVAAAAEAANLDKTARAAYASGNQPGLTNARLAIIKLREPAPRVAILKKRVEDFRKTYAGDEYAKKGQGLLDDLDTAADNFKAADDFLPPLILLGQVDVAAIQALAAIETDVTAITKVSDTVVQKADKLDAAARDAYAKGNQADLTKARVTLIDLSALNVKVGPLKVKVQAFMKQHPNTAHSKKAQTLLDSLEQAGNAFEYANSLVAPLVKLGQVQAAPKVNVPKAIKVLKLESGDTRRLTTILDGPPNAYEKMFDQFAKEKKMTINGKAIVTLLRKEQAIA